MKWFVLILLLITATATFVPCCQDESNETISLTHKHEESGACSPLNSCATCPGSVQLVKSLMLEQPFIDKIQHEETVITFHQYKYSNSFWQPPKMHSGVDLSYKILLMV